MEPDPEMDVNQIICGDCLEVMSDFPDNSMDLIVTDPPYNIGKKYSKHKDNMPDELYWKWIKEIMSQCYRIMNDGYLYISHSDKGIYILKPILETMGFEYIQTLIWYGRNGYSNKWNRKSWSYRHEPILFMSKGEPEPLLLDEPNAWYTSIIEAPRPQSNFSEGRVHPTQKPILLYKKLIQITPGNIILDPFSGSGASCLAAKQLNRTYIGIEIDPKYADISIRRLAETTKQMKFE